jgi:hypothetical protein
MVIINLTGVHHTSNGGPLNAKALTVGTRHAAECRRGHCCLNVIDQPSIGAGSHRGT